MQDKSERRERIKQVEGRPREQGRKGRRIDLSSRERSKWIDRDIKRKGRNSKEKGRRGRDETTRTSSGHAVTVSCFFTRSSYLAPLLLSSPL
jgi:hypothetical protein